MDGLFRPGKAFQTEATWIFVRINFRSQGKCLQKPTVPNNVEWLLWPFRTASTDLGKEK